MPAPADDGYEQAAARNAAKVVARLAGSQPEPRRRASPRVAAKPSASQGKTTDHFTRYLDTRMGDAALEDADRRSMMLTGWLLDQNIYELEVLLSGDAEPNLENVQQLTRLGLTTDDVVAYLEEAGAPPDTASAEDRILFLGAFVGRESAGLTGSVGRFAQKQGGDLTSVLKWGGVTPWGAGLGASLTMHRGGLPGGSAPHSDPAWIKTIEGHVPRGGTTSIYVRGHLINDNIGGPGLDYNMVPLTGKPATKAGGNDANAVHLNSIEKAAKVAEAAVRAGGETSAFYQVSAIYGRSPRPATADVAAQAKHVRAVLNRYRGRLAAKAQKMDRAGLEAEVRAGMAKSAPGEPSFDPLQINGAAVPDEIAQNLFVGVKSHAFSGMTLAALEKADPEVSVELLDGLDLGIARASLGGREPRAVTIGELLEALDANAFVWASEDEYVPAQLRAMLTVTHLNGVTEVKHPDVAVPVVLPSDPSKVDYRPRTKSEWA